MGWYGWGVGSRLRYLFLVGGAECRGKPFDPLDQELCLYLGTSS